MSYSYNQVVYAAAGLGSESDLVLTPVAWVQRALWGGGQNPGPVDGKWGPNTMAALRASMGAPVLSTIQANGRTLEALATGATQITLPYIMVMADTPGNLHDYHSRYRSTAQSEPSGSGPRPSIPSTVTNGEQPATSAGGGTDMPWLPWAIGGVAMLGIGGFFVWQGTRRRRKR